MTKRTNSWPMVVPPGTTTVGTARVRDDAPSMGYAQRKLAEKFGTKPAHSFDDIADGTESAGANTPAYRREATPSLGMAKPKKRPKYGNRKCTHEGIKFDSEKERSRWFHLIQLQAGGQIRDLELQVAFVLTPRKQRDDGTWERASKYIADFVYLDVATGKRVVEDVKSKATRKNTTYVQKRKQMLAVHDITIKEI
ncbi:DUF1064 domain-containing protein [Paraburkholderia unamae]|uniref:Uncharacterized protein DUF1064 n=1 Tax=Paraburkholderia unamae TaxID=219649 RepID=A0ABX5KTM2_9BURK|nr:DUF1064 domain-containing protein [Paraburkholderia unamae]PVX86453.1 uncharacterized protein DUF1064 [Paraburkholderia unamae]